jgi:hypothetical protein
LNFHGESHEKGLPKDAHVKASGGVLCPLEAFILIYQGSFPTYQNIKME